MGTSKIKNAADGILNRLETVKGRGEEATKQAMVLPMLDALGYDIWNPQEVCPEFEADVAVKKNGQKEKVDYAILFGGEPCIFIEVKEVGESLDGHQGQLKRYFMSTPSVSLGILTNGTEYRFFTDTGEPNIQDDDPFHIINLCSIDQGLDVMARFQRDVFSPASIRDYATELTYTSKIVAFLQSELDVQENQLSDEFIGWILRSPGMYDGRIMQGVIEKFRPIAKAALQRVLGRIVRRIVTDVEAGVSTGARPAALVTGVDKKNEGCVESDSTDGPNIPCNSTETEYISGKAKRIREIMTTDEELECFAIVKRIFEESPCSRKTIYDPTRKMDAPIEIAYKDTTTYFGIYFNKPSWWNIRISVEGKTKWIGFDLDSELGSSLVPQGFQTIPPCAFSNFRIKINASKDVLELRELVLASFEKTILDRDNLR